MVSHAASRLALFVKLFLVILILSVSGGVGYYFFAFPAHTNKKVKPAQTHVAVKVLPIEFGNHPVIIEVMGQVIPAQDSDIKSRVSGEIISVSKEFVPGGILLKDETILNIDPTDYELEINVKKAAVQQAQAALDLELGQQEIAKNELKIIESSTGRKISNSDLALRKPQFEQAKANLAAAKAELELAELNLKRTELKAPFNGIIQERFTNLGNIVSTQDTLANMVNTDEYWISAEIPVYDIRWLELPTNTKDGSKAVVQLGDTRGKREGSLLKTTGTVDEQSRLARLLISVKDPLLINNSADDQPPLVLGDFVRIHLIGNTLNNAAKINQSYIRNNNSLWLERNGKLYIQSVTIPYRDREYAYITDGLQNGDKIIVSNIITPVHGMDVRIISDEVTNSTGP